MSALKLAPLSTGVVPDRFVGEASAPVAVSVQSVAAAVPPLSLVMVLRRWSCGGLSLLLIVQVASCPFWSVIWVASPCVPPTQTQSLAV